MKATSPKRVEILDGASVSLARETARSAAGEAGFNAQTLEEIILTVTELSTNLLKHAKGGTLLMTPLEEGKRLGLEIETMDDGPGIADPKEAVADGVSTAGGMGGGLGAVNRLMDEFHISSERGAGTRVICRKWVHDDGISPRPCPLAFGVATRPHPRYDVNGDAFVIRQWSESALVGVIDGLGHGPSALIAAQAARQFVESHLELPLAEMFFRTGGTCANTRGVVMALARFDWERQKLSFASIGDIEARVWPTGKPGFVVRRGIVGLNAPRPVVTEHDWPAHSLLVLHSDGLSINWRWSDFPGILEKPATDIAAMLLHALAKSDDDATVVVVRSAPI